MIIAVLWMYKHIHKFQNAGISRDPPNRQFDAAFKLPNQIGTNFFNSFCLHMYALVKLKSMGMVNQWQAMIASFRLREVLAKISALPLESLYVRSCQYHANL